MQMITSSRGCLAVLLLGILTLSQACRQADSHEARPGVILVITGGQGYEDLSFHGNPWLRTPHPDRFHGQE